MILRFPAFIFLLLYLLALPIELHAQTSTPAGAAAPDISKTAVAPILSASFLEQEKIITDRLANLRGSLASTEQALSRRGLNDKELARKFAETSTIRTKALELELELAPLVEQVSEQLNELGAAPKEGEPPEIAEIAKKRQELVDKYSRLDGESKASRLVARRAAQMEQQIIDNRRHRFVTQIFQRSSSLLNPQLWQAFWNGLDGTSHRFTLLIRDVTSVMKSKFSASSLLAPAVLAAILLISYIVVFLRRLLKQKISMIITGDTNDPIHHQTRIRLAGISFIRNGVVPAACVLSIYILGSSLGFFTSRLENFAFEIASISAAVIIAVALTQVFLVPNDPSRRLISMPETAAIKISRIIFLGVLLVAVLRLANRTSVILVGPFEVSVVFSALMSVVCFLCVALVLITHSSYSSDPGTDQRRVVVKSNFVRWGYLNPLFWLACVGGAISLVAGYIALAEFLAWQIVIAAIVFALLWLCIELLDFHRDRYLDAKSGRWRNLSQITGFSRNAVLQGSVFGFGLIKLASIIAAASIFMISWGYRTGDWAGPVSEAFFGFKIGGLSISLSSIVLALVIFAGGYVLTKAIQRWLRQQFLPTTKLDPGMRNSIATVFGYVGFVLASLLAITAAGLDFSNVAIVAGALSVGIGFGLQSIVNNFVSGLILLAERPIKSGDWIITSGGEGTVSKTSVRSTEIETFDGATVIIPNSTLITDAVTNWTHHNQKGRVKIAIGVGYDSDPDQVRDILLECGQSHPLVVGTPAPSVFFMEFGADALIFELRAYLPDIGSSITVKSDLRFSILKALREANIEISYPQRDIHIKSVPKEMASTISGAKRISKPKTRSKKQE